MVKVDVNKRDEWTVDLDISVDREKMEVEFEAAYKELNRTIRIPGFRPGKVPRFILEERMGRSLQKKAIENLLPKAYEEALAQAKIVPITPPKIENIDYKKDEYLKFRAQVEIKPEIILKDYKGIPLEKKIKKVTAQDIERELENLAEQNAELVSIDDRGVRDGDIITIDYEGLVNGIPIPGAKGENVTIQVGQTRLLEGVKDKLLGMEVNTTREITCTLPDDYPAKEFANQEAIFRINLKSIKEKRLPSIDDEFARDVGKRDLNELKEAIKSELERLNEEEARKELKAAIIKTLVSDSDLTIPKSLVEREINQMICEFENNLAPLRLTIEGYLKENNLTLENLRDDFRPKAIERLKAAFILDAIAEKEGIQVDEDKIEEEIKRLAKVFSKTTEEMKELLTKQGKIDETRERLRQEKTIDLLLEYANIREVTL